MSWTPMADIERRSEELAIVNRIFNAQQAITDAQFNIQDKGPNCSNTLQITDISDHHIL